MNRYDDIINLPHPEPSHPRMSLESRAAQFAPFAALSGHGEAISETSRQTERMIELSEDEISRISKNIFYAYENDMTIKLSFFLPDRRKSGGGYLELREKIKKIDETEHLLIMNNGIRIPFCHIIGVSFVR